MDTATITWGDLEVGHQIKGGWRVADLTATHITVADEEDGTLSTFKRKEPWEPVEIIPLTTRQVVEAFGGVIIREDYDSGEVRFFMWPDDPRFINAAQSHLSREHEIDPGDRTYEELRTLHAELHETTATTHAHIERKD